MYIVPDQFWRQQASGPNTNDKKKKKKKKSVDCSDSLGLAKLNRRYRQMRSIPMELVPAKISYRNWEDIMVSRIGGQGQYISFSNSSVFHILD